MNMMGMMGLIGFTQPSAMHSKDFRKLESELVKVCVKQCLRKECHYHNEADLCMTKCYDLAYIYAKIGLHELNAFSQENNLTQ